MNKTIIALACVLGLATYGVAAGTTMDGGIYVTNGYLTAVPVSAIVTNYNRGVVSVAGGEVTNENKGSVTLLNIGNNVISNVNAGSVTVGGTIGILSKAIVPITFPIENRVDLGGTVGFSYEMDKLNPWTNVPVLVQLAVPESDYARVYVATVCSSTFFIARAPYEYFSVIVGSNVFTNVIWQTVSPAGATTNCLTLRGNKLKGGVNQIGFWMYTTTFSLGNAGAGGDPNWTNRLVNVWVDTWDAPKKY